MSRAFATVASKVYTALEFPEFSKAIFGRFLVSPPASKVFLCITTTSRNHFLPPSHTTIAPLRLDTHLLDNHIFLKAAPNFSTSEHPLYTPPCWHSAPQEMYVLAGPFLNTILISLQLLPRASSTFRTPALRSPLGSTFARGYADGADEKVKGAVIGIDLGMP